MGELETNKKANAQGGGPLLRTDRLTRALYSTDACNYRVVPRAVAAPRTDSELCQLVNEALERKEPVTMRGRGTSCAGNAIGPGLVIDTAQHLGSILALHPDPGTATSEFPPAPSGPSAWVEPGCVMAKLQQAAAPHGLRFGPDPSTWTRATLGGAIGNNACGPHAQAWGRTADNIIALDVIDGQGRQFRAGSGSPAALDVVPGLRELVMENLALIRTHCGKFSRQVSAYSLEQLLPENGYNLARFLGGTEGTLAVIRRAHLRLVPIPAAPVLVALGYTDMITAAADVPTVNTFQPLAVEGLDARLVEVVRRVKGPGAVPELPAGQGWLLVEVGGENLESALKTAHEMAAAAHTEDVAVYPPGTQAAALWRIRADGAGLGGRTPLNPDGTGGDPAWPGWEDAAVPPENLADYLRDFTALMDRHGVDGLLYGHFGDGCVHVRLNLELGSAAGVGRARDFLQEAAQIVTSYGGSISGEHGDGRARSQFLSTMYPPAMMDLFARVKALFDPGNLLNPGVIINPDTFDQNLRLRSAHPLDHPRPGFSFPHDKNTGLGGYANAVHRCTGVGKCLAMENTPGSWMCPSYLATGQEKDSTRGRARALQEVANGQLLKDFRDPALLSALDLCLSCKACSTDCPTGMDMATYKSEALWRAYQHHPTSRPRSHWLLGWLPFWLRLARAVPGGGVLANFFLGKKTLRDMVFTIFGIDRRREMATFHPQSFTTWAARRGWKRTANPPAGPVGQNWGGSLDNIKQDHKKQDHKNAQPQPRPGEKPLVALWVDSFSEGIDHGGARAALELLTRAGYQPFLPPRTCCGLTWISTGQLAHAKKELSRLCEILGPLAVNGIPIVGVEPSCTATLRDDLPRLLPEDPRAHAIAAATYTLAELLTDPTVSREALPQLELPDLRGKTIVAQPHCHHYSVLGWQADRQLLEQTGANIVEVKGCCGMAGNFGMEQGHYEVSARVWEKTLAAALEAGTALAQKNGTGEVILLADGFSCRTQAAQMGGRTDALHLAQLLLGESI